MIPVFSDATDTDYDRAINASREIINKIDNPTDKLIKLQFLIVQLSNIRGLYWYRPFLEIFGIGHRSIIDRRVKALNALKEVCILEEKEYLRKKSEEQETKARKENKEHEAKVRKEKEEHELKMLQQQHTHDLKVIKLQTDSALEGHKEELKIRGQSKKTETVVTEGIQDPLHSSAIANYSRLRTRVPVSTMSLVSTPTAAPSPVSKL